MFFPKYSNLYPELREVLDSRVQNTNNPISLGGVSGLSTWIRVISAANDGLVMQSIHKPDSYNISTEFEKRYGNDSKPGIIGYALDLSTPIEIEGTGRGLRPSPIITDFKIDEAQQGALKLISFNVRCFTMEQVDVVTKYFLEPGFHILTEWGWNVNDAYSQRVGGGGAITPCDIAQYNNWPFLKEKRKNSKYQYDASLGIVTGGGVKFGDGETYDVEVKTSGVGQVAEYMQVQSSGNRTDIVDENNPPSFEPEKIGESTPGVALFKQMYNGLPNTKKTARIKKWASGADSNGVSWAYEGNFVNFDEEIKDYLLKTLTKGATIRNKSGDKLEIPTDVPLFDEERFIRFELAVEIFNSFVMDLEPKETECSGIKSQLLKIDISNTAIKAFPHMWSTDKSVLYVPNTQAPNFGLRQALVDSGNEEPVKFINFEELNNVEFQANLHPLVEQAPDDERAEKNGSANDPATGQSRPVPFAFPCLYDLDESILTYSCDDTVEPLQERAGFWGWLKDLYINYHFFVECLSKSNMNSKDALFEMLNGMSSACNSIWDFQLREGPALNDPDGPTVLCVEDVTFRGYIPEETVENIATYQARGVKSPFTSISWDMSIPGALQSSVMIKKMSNNKVDGSGDTPHALYGGVFSDPGEVEDKVGTILNKISAQGESDEPETLENQEEETPPANAKTFDLFANRAGVFSRIQNRKGKIDIVNNLTDKELTKKDNGNIESLLCVGTWDDKAALKSVELIDRGLKKGVNGEVDKEYTNRVNPIPGLAKVQFSIQGLSGFKVGDMIQFEGIPLKYGPPSFYQVVKTSQSISGTSWSTAITCDFRLIGSEV
jgi:hypothetical protein